MLTNEPYFKALPIYLIMCGISAPKTVSIGVCSSKTHNDTLILNQSLIEKQATLMESCFLGSVLYKSSVLDG